MICSSASISSQITIHATARQIAITLELPIRMQLAIAMVTALSAAIRPVGAAAAIAGAYSRAIERNGGPLDSTRHVRLVCERPTDAFPVIGSVLAFGDQRAQLRASSRQCASTICGILTPRGCSLAGPISKSLRSGSVTQTLRRPRSTSTPCQPPTRPPLPPYYASGVGHQRDSMNRVKSTSRFVGTIIALTGRDTSVHA